MEVVYRGRRYPKRGAVVEVWKDDRRHSFLNQIMSLMSITHSPTGFEWGYGGSGPSQLALALLMEVAPLAVALKHYHRFKEEIVAKLNTEGWELKETAILDWLAGQGGLS